MTQETLWIGTGWKMNKTLAEARAYARALAATPVPAGTQRFVIPPFTVIRKTAGLLARSDVLVGAQNMHWAEEGLGPARYLH